MTSKYENKIKKLKALQKSYADNLPLKISEIFDLWGGIKTSKPAKIESEEFHRALHTLAGTSASFGFKRLGKKARDIELVLLEFRADSKSEKFAELFTSLDLMLSELKGISKKGPDGREEEILNISPKRKKECQPQVVYLLEDEQFLAEETAKQLSQFGYHVEIFTNCKQLSEATIKKSPDVFLVDINLPEGSDAGTKVISSLSTKKLIKVPVVFISGHDNWSNRLKSIRAGGQAFITKPTHFHDLVELLDKMTGKEEEKKYRILIVDDSKEVGEHYSVILQLANMEVKVVEHPFKLLEIIPEFAPDLILMDLYMPKCSGFEAATIIRQNKAYTNIPIVYLSTEIGFAKQLDAMQVGGDDFLQKPIQDNHLVTAVTIRAKRFRELTALMNKDSLTGLVNHINLKQALSREVAMASRRNVVFSFVMIDIDNFKRINDDYGHPEGDKVIKTLAKLLRYRLRKGDISARYGGEEFAMILPETNVIEAEKVVKSLLERFAQMKFEFEEHTYSVTFSAGIATHPDYKTVEGLIFAADKALYTAKNNGRNQVALSPKPAKKED
jgi:diguanylate cyclase (GGDEF)-like protein